MARYWPRFPLTGADFLLRDRREGAAKVVWTATHAFRVGYRTACDDFFPA